MAPRNVGDRELLQMVYDMVYASNEKIHDVDSKIVAHMSNPNIHRLPSPCNTLLHHLDEHKEDKEKSKESARFLEFKVRKTVVGGLIISVFGFIATKVGSLFLK